MYTDHFIDFTVCVQMFVFVAHKLTEREFVCAFISGKYTASTSLLWGCAWVLLLGMEYGLHGSTLINRHKHNKAECI